MNPHRQDLAIVSKVAVGPDGGGAGLQSSESRQLRAGILGNLRSLRVGQIAAVGLSNVSLRHATAGTDIVCAQNLFHLADRGATPALQECLSRGIAFVPFCPLGWPRRGQPVLRNPVVNQAAARLGATPA